MMKKLTILLLAVFLVGTSLLCLSCDEGEDPAMAMVRQTNAGSTPPPATETTPPPAETPAPATETAETPVATEGEPPALAGEGEAAPATEGEETSVEGDETAPAEGETAVEGEEPAVEAEAPAAEGEEPAVEAEAPATEGEVAAPEDEAAVEGEASPEDVPAGLPGTEEEGFIEDEVPENLDPIDNFKAMDPRDIIISKYEDMAGRKTEPWNEEDPEHFIPETGRPDPMTRVFDSVPDELKPPRAGETDQNQIDEYLVATEATAIVESIALMLQCHNVIQIGLDKYGTFSIPGGGQFLLSEGQQTGQTVGSSTGIPIQISIVVASITTDEVRVNISATGYGTTTSVSKSVVYIPANEY